MKHSLSIPAAREVHLDKSNFLGRTYNSLLSEFKRFQTGYSALAIIAQSCIGSLAAMALLMNAWSMGLKMTLLALVTVFCMAFNAAVLAQLKAKMTFNLLLLSLIFNCGIIAVNLI